MRDYLPMLGALIFLIPLGIIGLIARSILERQERERRAAEQQQPH